MVTIPVSMYQTVVTNLQNLSEAGIPVTMSTLSAAVASEAGATATTDTTEQQQVSTDGNSVNTTSASSVTATTTVVTGSVTDEVDVKTTINGGSTQSAGGEDKATA